MAPPIRSIVILGGGTAGWLAAAYLNRALGHAVEITLVESKTIGRIGVGEATIPTLRDTLAFLGVDENAWLTRCNGSFKSAVKFINWRRPSAAGEDHVYYHTFFAYPERLIQPYPYPFFPRVGQGFSIGQFWLKRHLSGKEPRRFDVASNPLTRMCDLRRAPKAPAGQPDPGLRYAYHLDASLLAEMLCKIGTERGVRHVVADVTGASLDERGFVKTIHTQQGIDLSGELFVDCSGFRGFLINQTLGEPFQGENHYLLCDSAVAMPADNHAATEGLRPYTAANAMDDGWIWEIPLSHRDGTGYVYSSQTTTSDAAEATLRKFLGDRVHDVPANHIKMRVGYNPRPFFRNVVAIGLSASFVEPLESTTIFLIEYALANLVMHFPDTSMSPVRAERFNRVMFDAYEDVRDFVVMHYCLTDRDDTEFWRRVRAAQIPASLQAKLDQFAEGVIVPDVLNAHRLFDSRAFLCILSGMNFPFRRNAPIIDLIDDGAADAAFAAIAEETRRLEGILPDNYRYLMGLYGEG